jgi:hypothetical protein
VIDEHLAWLALPKYEADFSESKIGEVGKVRTRIRLIHGHYQLVVVPPHVASGARRPGGLRRWKWNKQPPRDDD